MRKREGFLKPSLLLNYTVTLNQFKIFGIFIPSKNSVKG